MCYVALYILRYTRLKLIKMIIPPQITELDFSRYVFSRAITYGDVITTAGRLHKSSENKQFLYFSKRTENSHRKRDKQYHSCQIQRDFVSVTP